MIKLLFIYLTVVILWFFRNYWFSLAFIRISIAELNVIVGFRLLLLYYAFWFYLGIVGFKSYFSLWRSNFLIYLRLAHILHALLQRKRHLLNFEQYILRYPQSHALYDLLDMLQPLFLYIDNTRMQILAPINKLLQCSSSRHFPHFGEATMLCSETPIDIVSIFYFIVFGHDSVDVFIDASFADY